MSKDKKIFDDIARMAGGAVNVMSGLQQQVRDDVRSRFEEFSGKLDLIARSEFDELHSVVKKLNAKIAALEAQGSRGSAPAVRNAKAGAKKVKTAVKKTAKKANTAKGAVKAKIKATKKKAR